MPEQSPSFGGPYVQLAAFCQIAMIENTGQLSVIRITDRVAAAGLTPEMTPTPIQITLAVVLKSGFTRAQMKLRVRATTPSGQAMPPLEAPVLFEGDERGIQLLVPMAFIAQEQGLYWFDVVVEESVLTRIPLRVMYQQVAAPPGFSLPGMPPGTPPGSH